MKQRQAKEPGLNAMRRLHSSTVRTSQRCILVLVSLVSLGFAVKPARAESCSLSMTNVAFGSFDATTGAAVDTTGTMSFACTAMATNSSYNFCISIAIGSVFTGTQRQMASGASRLNFDLYSDAARTTKWGSYETGYGGGGFSVNKPTGGSSTLNFTVTVYGRIAASQTTAPAGSYSSTFTGNPFVRWDEAPPAGDPCLTSTKTLQTNFNATATVTASCTVSATNMNFGSVGSLGASVDATTTVSPRCTNQTPYNVGLNAGTGTGATVSVRKMTLAGATINYSLYSNAGRTTVWGNTVGTDTVAGTGTGATQSVTVYGRVPVQSTPGAGTYTDTVIATVTY